MSELMELCKILKLPTLYQLYDKIEFMNKEQYLTEVLSGEVRARQEAKRKRLLKKASFPSLKSLRDFIPDAITFPAKINLDKLANLEFIKQKQNIIMLGAVGTGKTHLATTLGVKACEEGYPVRFTEP